MIPAVDDILAAGPERLVKQAGVNDAVARNIAYWYADNVNRRLVRRLRTPDLVELGWTGSAQKLGAGRFLDKWFLWR